MNWAAEALWRNPGCFGATRTLGTAYWLGCVVSHNSSVRSRQFPGEWA